MVAVVSLAMMVMMMCYVKWLCLFYQSDRFAWMANVYLKVIGGNGPMELAPSMRLIVTH